MWPEDATENGRRYIKKYRDTSSFTILTMSINTWERVWHPKSDRNASTIHSIPRTSVITIIKAVANPTMVIVLNSHTQKPSGLGLSGTSHAIALSTNKHIMTAVNKLSMVSVSPFPEYVLFQWVFPREVLQWIIPHKCYRIWLHWFTVTSSVFVRTHCYSICRSL